MFELKKVTKARKRLQLITNFLFKLFQINLRYKETRKEYGIEIFEYFYLPWRTNEVFNSAYSMISDYTLNQNPDFIHYTSFHSGTYLKIPHLLK